MNAASQPRAGAAQIAALRQAAIEALRQEGPRWLFALRAMLSLYIAGWIAMRLELSQPSTAMMTTLIVMNRQSGMVLAKSFYRAIGTLVGAVAAVLMMSLFPQERVLILLSLSLWVGLCAGGALLYRNFAAYGFVLSGYTATIVLMPVLANPLLTFNSAVERVSEVLLGVTVAGLVSDTVFPTRMRDALRHAIYSQFAGFIGFVSGSIAGKVARADMERAHLRLVRGAIDLEDLRSNVVFEDADSRARSNQMRLFNQRFMAASTSFQSLHHLINRCQRLGRERAANALIELYQPLATALAAPDDTGDANAILALEPRLGAARARMAAHRDDLRAALGEGEIIDFDTGAALLLRFTDELFACIEVTAKLRAARPVGESTEKVRFTRSNDFLSAGITAAHVATTMLLLGLFWIATAWPSGAIAMFIASVYCGLLAASPNPVTQTRRSAVGWLFGLAAGFLCLFFVTTRLDGYALLIAGTLPFLVPAPYLSTYPDLAGIGGAYGMAIVSSVAIANPMQFDPLTFLNSGIAQLAGLSAASLAFLVAPPAAGSRWYQRRQFERLRRQIAFVARAPLSGLAHRFESVNRDLVHQIIAHMPQTRSGQLLAWALNVHETGRALIDLRQDAAQLRLSDAQHQAIDQVVRQLARFYDDPDTSRYATVREATRAAMRQTQEAMRERPELVRLLHHLHVLRMALLDDQSVIARYMPPDEPTPEAAHAP